MSYERVLLLRQNTSGIFYAPRRPPVGIGYLAEALKRNHIEYAIIDRELGYSYEDITTKIKDFKPDLVGISMVTLGYLTTYEFINQIKSDFGVDVIIGGPHVSAFGEKILEECNSIDYASLGEGENTLVELCQSNPVEKIHGLYYRKNGTVKFTGKRPPNRDIDSLYWPSYDGFEMNRYLSNEMGILTSRGCPYACIFCSVHTIMGAKIRLRSVQSVVDEMEFWYKKNYKTFLIMDDNFTFDKQRVFDICDELESRQLTDIRISLANGVRADKVDEPMLRRLKQLGAWEIQIAVESASDRVLELLRKGETLDTIRKAIDIACRLDYDVGTNFLVGSPGETWEEVQNSFKFVKEYPLQLAFFFNIIPYPGTRLFDNLQANNLLREDPKEYLGTLREGVLRPVFETPELSIDKRVKLLRQAKRVSENVRRQYIKRRLSRFGPLAFPLAFIGSWTVTAWLLKKNKFFSKYLLPIYYKMRKYEAPEQEIIQQSDISCGN